MDPPIEHVIKRGTETFRVRRERADEDRPKPPLRGPQVRRRRSVKTLWLIFAVFTATAAFICFNLSSIHFDLAKKLAEKLEKKIEKKMDVWDVASWMVDAEVVLLTSCGLLLVLIYETTNPRTVRVHRVFKWLANSLIIFLLLSLSDYMDDALMLLFWYAVCCHIIAFSNVVISVESLGIFYCPIVLLLEKSICHVKIYPNSHWALVLLSGSCQFLRISINIPNKGISTGIHSMINIPNKDLQVEEFGKGVGRSLIAARVVVIFLISVL